MYIVETNNLTKSYGLNTVVNNVSIHINEGDIYGFVGQNGAGKTTVIRLLTGLINPTSGTYSLFGVDKNDREILNSRKKVGAIVEAPSIDMNLTAYQNLYTMLLTLGINDNSIISKVLDMVDLGYLYNDKKSVKNFSLGMRQRLGIAMALVNSPKLLILDEPINGLDPQGIVDVRNLILKLNREYGVTILISSHYLDELSKITTRIGILDHGNLLQEITLEDFEKEANRGMLLTLNTNEFEDIIREFGLSNYKIKGKQILIKDTFNLSDLVIYLKKNNIELIEAKRAEMTFEQYYLQLIGGNRNV